MNDLPNRTPAAFYAHVSSDRQDVDLSVAAQLRALCDFAGRNGDRVAREYVDEAESGRVADRPQLRKMLDRIWRVIEKTDLKIDDAAPRIREHMARTEQFETAAEQTSKALAERRVLLDKVEVVAAFAADMAEFRRTSDIIESKAFLRTFIRRIEVEAGRALINYTIPMPEDSPIGRRDAAEVALAEGICNSEHDGGPSMTERLAPKAQAPPSLTASWIN